MSPQGVRVPEVLRKYIPGAPETIKYTRELPKDTTSLKAKGRAAGPRTQVAPLVGEAAEKIGKLTV